MTWGARTQFQYCGIQPAQDPAYAFVTTLLHGTELVDRSQYGATVSLSGSASIDSTTKPYGASSFKFTGNPDGVSVAYNANRNVFFYSGGPGYATAECWIKTSAAGTFPRVLELADGSYQQGAWLIYLNDTATGDVAFQYGAVSSSAALMKTAGGLVNDNAWHHIAVTRNINSWNLWVDGVSRASASTLSSQNTGALAVPFLVGKAASLVRPYVGNVADVRLTGSDPSTPGGSAACRYTSTFTVPSSPFPNS